MGCDSQFDRISPEERIADVETALDRTGKTTYTQLEKAKLAVRKAEEHYKVISEEYFQASVIKDRTEMARKKASNELEGAKDNLRRLINRWTDE